MARITMQEIADRLGVHVTTVSKALLNNPSVAQKTRTKVAELAEEMGYAPDPRLRALAEYRTEKRTTPFRSNIAWILNHGEDARMERFPAYADYLEGAKVKAAQLGYGLSEYRVKPGNGAAFTRLLRMLKARGVLGIVLAPQEKMDTIDGVSWEAFSVVSIGFTLQRPCFHRVSVDHYRLIRSLVGRLESEGSRRIGFYLDAEEQVRTEERMLASAHFCASRSEIFVKRYDSPSRDSFLRWARRCKPDTIVCRGGELTEWAQASRSVRRVVSYALDSEAEAIDGMYHNNRVIGEQAIVHLDGLIRRGERGIPAEGMELLLEARWVPGE